ncbi:phage baseplate assembly protein V, partial [Escherichia coli]|nr:phage baseplate assembly protein V [Escherichia coli]
IVVEVAADISLKGKNIDLTGVTTINGPATLNGDLEINGSAHATGDIFADGQNSNHHSH